MSWRTILIGTGVFLIIFIGYVLVFKHIYPGLLLQGSFQDFFAGLSTLFSGLAFLGLIFAILLQREELQLQRKELEFTRRELKRTAEAQELSQQELSKQAASLKATAKLNGLSALLQRYTSLRNEAMARTSPLNAQHWDTKAEEVTTEIEKIIEGK